MHVVLNRSSPPTLGPMGNKRKCRRDGLKETTKKRPLIKKIKKIKEALSPESRIILKENPISQNLSQKSSLC